MTRLQTLIKEVLSQPKKKDCNCGCNDCGGKAPILTEGKIKHLISEGLQYHMDKKIQLHESVYRIGSEKHFELIREARALWVRGIINVSEDDQAILETNLGHFGMYEGEAVPLDMPMVNEGFYSSPSDMDETGLNVRPKDQIHANMLKDALENSDLYAEWNAREGYFFFPEEQDLYDQLEMKIQDLMDENNIQGYIEGVFEESLNENETAFEYNKARAGRIMKDLFGLDFEFDYTYKPEGNKIVIDAEGYNPDGTLFDMKDVHKEKIIRTFQDKMPNADAKPNMGGGITVNLKESLNEETVDYDFSKEELIRVIQQLKSGASTEVGMIKAFEKALDRELTDDEIRGFKIDPSKVGRASLEERINTILEAKKKKKKDPPIGKPKRGGPKAYYVYVRDPKTKKIKKVTFGSGGLRAKIRNPKARKAFAARHRCKTATDRTTARYWSCRLPRYAKQLGLGSNMNTFW